jgi:hypothetical protein
MSNRYLVKIQTSTVIPVIVVADSTQDASDRALKGEGKPGDSWIEDAEVKRVVKIEE